MKEKLMRGFSYSAGALLLALATALFISNCPNAGLVHPQEPVFSISVPVFFWIVGGLSSLVALVCLFGKRISVQATLTCWMAMNLAVYQWALVSSGVEAGFRGYLGPLADAFGFWPGTVEMLLKAAVCYLLIGSVTVLAVTLAEQFLAGKKQPRADYFKIPCPHCSERIEFPASGIGLTISCPHCAGSVMLQTPETKIAGAAVGQ
jgi:hypothetical protein